MSGAHVIAAADMQAAAVATTTAEAAKENEEKIPIAAAKKRRFFFALCESCFWSATILQQGSLPGGCPSCSSGSQGVSMIPLAPDEEYRLKVAPAGAGLEMSFGRRARQR